MRLTNIVPALALTALLCGCGQPKYSVSGKVGFGNGKPAYEGTMVIFTSANGLQGGFGVVTGSEGKFPAVSFEKPGDGLPLGTYGVSVRPPDPRTVADEVRKTAPPNFGIDTKYMSNETSGLKLQVDRDVVDFAVTLDAAPGGAAPASAAALMQGRD